MIFAISIGVMFLVAAFLFVDVTGGKKPTSKTLKIYSYVFVLSGLVALITYNLT